MEKRNKLTVTRGEGVGEEERSRNMYEEPMDKDNGGGWELNVEGGGGYGRGE